ncbi:MAG: B12-binding domain-containing radical SAM protein [Proteobacteria bacterium]|nr:B12-binding domain-containing radical SAM protein [Pseudomonadota bacterium]
MSNIYERRKEVIRKEKGIKSRRGRKNVVLFYPNTYSIGISTLSLHRISEIIQEFGEIGFIRYFLEDEEGEKRIFPLDDLLDLSDISAIAFFLSYENDYFNVIKALRLLGISPFSKERRDLPIIIGGGVAVTDNPEPLAEIFDALFIGEAEDSFREFLKLLLEKNSKESLLRDLENIDDIYLPDKTSFEYDEEGYIRNITGRRVKRGVYENFNQDFSKSVFLTEIGEFGDTFLIELTRGCPSKCKFCISRSLYSPLRFANFDKVKEIIEEQRDIKKFGLLGASVSFHPYIKQIMEFLLERGKEFSLSSLRADLLDYDFISILKKGGIKTITIAPESGSERLRKLINKGINLEDIEKAIDNSLKVDIENLKLYFMIGLPFETWEDIDDIVKVSSLIRHLENKNKKRFKKVSFSISTFVPKPFTPLQWAPFSDIKETNEKIKYLRKKLTSKGVNVIYDLPKWARIQTILSRGDRKITPILFKGSDDRQLFTVNINPSFYAERERGVDEIFPWEVVDSGIERQNLLSQWLEYKKES